MRFLAVAGSFSIKLSGLADHWVLALLIASGVVVLCVLATRVFRKQWAKLREQLLVGGAALFTRLPRTAASVAEQNLHSVRVSSGSP